MILLLGGTSETATVAVALATAGRRVLVSTATDVPLDSGAHPNILHRHGKLDDTAMVALIRSEKIQLLVDVTHPYASGARRTAVAVAHETAIPYLTYVRPETHLATDDMTLVVGSHEVAASIAVQRGQPILLTIGSRNVGIYAAAANPKGLTLVARILDHVDSLDACRTAGIPADRIITGRGPFSIEENSILIRRFHIGTLITKNSGDAGGFDAKLIAARQEQCLAIIVGRPTLPKTHVFRCIEDLVSETLKLTKEQYQ